MKSIMEMISWSVGSLKPEEVFNSSGSLSENHKIKALFGNSNWKNAYDNWRKNYGLEKYVLVLKYNFNPKS